MHFTALDQLGLKHNCDKSSRARAGKNKNEDTANLAGHDYLRKYEMFLSRFKDEKLHLLELGIGPDWNMGASLKIWRDYFTSPERKFTIVDINPNASSFESEDTEILIGNLGDVEFLNTLGNGKYDVIIDDASHFWDHQILSLLHLFDSVKEGGVFIMEDIHTSFGGVRDKYANGSPVDAHIILSHLATIVAGRGRKYPPVQIDHFEAELRKIAAKVESVTFIGASCIICKSGYY